MKSGGDATEGGRELRLSEDVQKAFARVRGKTNGVFDVIELLQAQVAREFGLEEDVG